MITAFSGTSSDRNTTMSNRNDSDSTAAKNQGSRASRKSEKSRLTATLPVTLTSAPVASSTGGSTSPRSRSTSSVVASSWGELVGTACQITAAGSSGSLGWGSDTDSTPGSAATTSPMASRSAGSVPSGSSAASVSGPLNPGPKPSTNRAYACLVDVSSAKLDSSEN